MARADLIDAFNSVVSPLAAADRVEHVYIDRNDGKVENGKHLPPDQWQQITFYGIRGEQPFVAQSDQFKNDDPIAVARSVAKAYLDKK